MERRHKRRQNAELDITIVSDNQTINTKTANISIDGIFIFAPPNPFPVYTPVRLALSIKQGTACVVHLLTGFVVRSTETGMALTYITTELLEKYMQEVIKPPESCASSMQST